VEGVKSSGASEFAAGEIGGQQQRVLGVDSPGGVVVDPELRQEIESTSGALVIESSRVSPTDPTDRIATRPAADIGPAAEPELAFFVGDEPPPSQPEARSGAPSPVVSFETFRAPGAAVFPPPGAEVRPPNATAASVFPAMVPPSSQLLSGPAGQFFPVSGGQGLQPPGSAPVPVAVAPLASPGGTAPFAAPVVPGVCFAPESPFGQETLLPAPSAGGAMKAIGLLMTILLALGTLFFFFVLYQNDGSLDLANVGTMLDRTLGRRPKEAVALELRGLEATLADAGEARIASGERVVTAQGMLKNNDTRPRRFISVRARLRDRHHRDVVVAEAPVGNVFTKVELLQLTKASLQARMNPAGRDGRSARIDPGRSVPYMVYLTGVPGDYSPSKYHVVVEVSQAEVDLEP
jgi:hypothetical protein